jgi:hypothetical protein
MSKLRYEMVHAMSFGGSVIVKDLKRYLFSVQVPMCFPSGRKALLEVILFFLPKITVLAITDAYLHHHLTANAKEKLCICCSIHSTPNDPP